MAFIHIAGNTYELIVENRNGWNVEAFRTRYSDVLDRYDYIVGDWGYNQLRLKGFFKDGHQKATKDSAFSYVTDYINEYCNFGCAYFLLEKKNSTETIEDNGDHIYIEEAEYSRPIPSPVSKDKDSKDRDSKDTKVAKESKDKESRDKDVKTKAASQSQSAAGDESASANGKDGNRNKRSSQREKQGDGSLENGAEKPQRSRNNQRPRNNQRHHAKVQSDPADDMSELETESKREAKMKRKEHFYRKGNRGHDKKGKGNKGQAEHSGTGNK